MIIEFAYLRKDRFCRLHKCRSVTVNKIHYEIHQAYDKSGYIISGPLPGIINDRFYSSVEDAIEVITKHHQAIEDELKRRQLCLPLH